MFQRIINGIWIFLIGLAFGFRAEAMMSTEAITYSNIAFALAGFFALVSLITWQSKKIWCGRENWYANSSYPHELPPNNPQRAIGKNRNEQWRSADAQEANAWFEVDMGKPRIIANIKFLADDSDIEKPKKWRMMFYGKNKNGLRQTLCHQDGENDIFVKGEDIPNPIQVFRTEIKEVAENMPASSNYAKRYLTTKVYWTISLIKVREYRFSICGKRFWKHEL